MDRQGSDRKHGADESSSKEASGMTGFLVTGIVRTSHGLDGFVKVESTSGEVAHFGDLDEVTLRFGGVGGTLKRFEIEVVDGSAQCLLVKFRGIDTLEQARKLAGAEVLVPRDSACPLEEGEFYVCDLCQCDLVYEGTPIGKIAGVMEGGADDLLEVILTEGSEFTEGKPKTYLVPFRKEFVGKVDMQARTVELMHRWILE
jgi:16S rRNA processing protein RimM